MILCSDSISGKRTFASSALRRDQNSALCANIASVRRATDWNYPSRVPGPYSVLDSCRPGIEAIAVQGLLQSPSHSRQSRRQNTGRSSWRQCVRDAEVISMERTLSRIISDAHGGIITNSPCTRPRRGGGNSRVRGTERGIVRSGSGSSAPGVPSR
jgi:hypothetical protein